MELTLLVLLSHGSTQFPEAPESRQLDPGPRTGSYPAGKGDYDNETTRHICAPADVAKPWNRIKEYPNGPTAH